jgi:hypothetical protein
MNNVRIINKLPQFTKSMESVLGDALREGARDILIGAKTKAPFQKDGLRSDTEITSPKKLTQRVSFYKEYAGYQEFGQRRDGSHKVKKYTTAGTGKHYLKDAGDKVVTRMPGILKKHGLRAKVW